MRDLKGGRIDRDAKNDAVAGGTAGGGHVRELAIGLGLAALTAIPYVIYNVQTGWAYLGALASPLGRFGQEGGEEGRQ